MNNFNCSMIYPPIYNMNNVHNPKVDLEQIASDVQNNAVAYGTKIVSGHTSWEQKNPHEIAAFKAGAESVINSLIQY